MPSDIRLRTSFPTHVKTAKLRKRLGADGVLSLITLWTYAAEHKPSGDLSGMSDEDVELTAGWPGEAGHFVQHAVEVGYLDRTDSGLVLHDWETHQPWVVHAEERSERAREAVTKRWNMQRERDLQAAGKSKKETGTDTSRIRTVCEPHTECNTPSPSPSPSPKPPTLDGVVGEAGANGFARGETKATAQAPRIRIGGASGGQRFWAAWVNACQAAGREEPARLGPDLGAAKELSAVIPGSDVPGILARYLSDPDPFLVKLGHALRYLGGRLNAYKSLPTDPWEEAEDRICRELRSKSTEGEL